MPCASLFLAGPLSGAQDDSGAVPPRSALPLHLDERERAAIDLALEPATGWLLAHQRPDGAFAPAVRAEVCPVALTALALWALAETADERTELDAAERAAGFLLRHRQADGGLYDPRRGLRVYTSGVAARALHAWSARTPSPELAAAAQEVELFAYREQHPESVLDESEESGLGSAEGAAEARRLLAELDGLTEEQRRALEFLSGSSSEDAPRALLRARQPDWSTPGAEVEGFGYEDVLPIVYRPLAPEHQLALRARNALRSHYTVERNPDLTRRYGEAGFQGGGQGLYYYYLLVARTMSAFAAPTIELADGTRRDWARELSRRLVMLQREDGRWVNESERWWEGEPVLVTSYCMLALRLCRDAPAAPGTEIPGGR